MKAANVLCLFGLWTLIAGGYLLMRSSFPLVWDDTPRVCAAQYDCPDDDLRNIENTRAFLERSFTVEWRPLANLYSNLALLWFAKPTGSPILGFAIVGAVLGLLAVAAFLVARRFTSTPLGALLAVFLLLFSTPIITGAWPVFNIQAIVPLLLCLGLLAYWRIVESDSYRVWYIAALMAIMILGPWYREFVGILPLLIIWLEVKRARGFTWLIGLAGLGLLHALFPTALLKWTFFPDAPLKPVFATGLLGQVLTPKQPGDSWLSGQLHNLKWPIGSHFLVLYPPLFLGLAFFSYYAYSLFLSIQPFRSHPTTDSRLFKIQPRLKTTLFASLRHILLPALFTVGSVAILYADSAWGQKACHLAIALGIALVAYQTDSLLAVWFLLSFLPFLKVFTEQVHLAYAILPASIGLACAVERLHTLVSGGSWPRRLLRYGLMGLLTVALVDHGLNLYSSYRVTKATTRESQEVARWFQANVPPGSVVISNVLHLQDIRLWSRGHIETYWTVGTGIPLNGGDLSDPAKLEALLKSSHGQRAVYFLDVDFNYLPGKVKYHSHKYIRDHNVTVEKVGLIATLQTRYPYLDPFKSWTARPYMSFMGPPDLENDYYTGPAQDGTSFLREVYAEYHLYKVTGTEVDRWNSVGPVRMVEEGYRHFNLLELNGRYFAIPQSEGPFDPQKVLSHGYSVCFVADSAAEIREQICKSYCDESP